METRMRRNGKQQASFVAAIGFGLAPLAVAVLRMLTGDDGTRMFWMAFMATGLAGGALATAIGRRRGRRAVMVDAIVILVGATLLSGATAFLLGATASAGIWAVSGAFGIALAASSVFVANSRTS